MQYSKGLKFVSNGDGTCKVTGIGTCRDKNVSIPPISPDGDIVASIGNFAFGEKLSRDGGFVSDCEFLTAITIPGSVKRIECWAFHRCKSLKSVTLEEGVTSIKGGAFFYCTSLTSITIPDSVTGIEAWAFEHCESLTNINIPDRVTSIEWRTFAGCTSLTSVTFGENSQLTSIGQFAFPDCTSLKSIIIPDNVTSIDEYAFHNCCSLINVTIKNGVTHIWDSAFKRCTALKSLAGSYKAFIPRNGKIYATQNYRAEYHIGEKFESRSKPSPRGGGLCYYTNMFDIFNSHYGEYGKDFIVAECDVSDENVGHGEDSKRCARWIKPIKLLTMKEVINILNNKKENN